MVIYINTGFSSVLEGGETAISQFFLKTTQNEFADALCGYEGGANDFYEPTPTF